MSARAEKGMTVLVSIPRPWTASDTCSRHAKGCFTSITRGLWRWSASVLFKVAIAGSGRPCRFYLLVDSTSQHLRPVSNPSPWLLCPLCSVAVERKMQSLRSKQCLERRLAFFFTSLLLLPAVCVAGVVGGDNGFWGLPTRRASQAARTSAQVPAHKQATCRATTVQR